jgi:hypothetical protein
MVWGGGYITPPIFLQQVRLDEVWQSRPGWERSGQARCVGIGLVGSRGTDVMGRVGYGAAGSLQWNGEMGYETERERSGRNLQRRGGGRWISMRNV